MVDFRPLDILEYLSKEFAEHLRASDVEPSEEILPDHLIWSFLDHLCRFVYYLPAFDSDPHTEQIQRAWFLISETLRWVQRHQKVGSVNYPDSCEIPPANAIHLSSSSGS